MATSRSKRFDEKRDDIIACATTLINERGVRGMTLADVASAAGIVPTSIAYYFGKKEALAAACFEVGLERMHKLVASAQKHDSARTRLTALIQGYFELRRRITIGEEPPIPVFSDIRTLGDPWREGVHGAWRRFFQEVRDLLRSPEIAWLRARAAAARTNIVIEHMLWLNVWLPRYDVDEYPRLCQRMLDIMLDGIALPGADWAPRPLGLVDPETDEQAMPDALLIAATRLINQHGYKGASVDKISAALQRTKGAFYHHINGKDDLVAAGFERSFEVLRSAQNKGVALDGDAWVRLHSIVAAVTEFQISSAGPLMRMSALQSMPEPMRKKVLGGADRIARRFSGMVSDGAAEGSLRPVDAAIASQMLNAAINAVADRRLAIQDPQLERAPLQYAVPMLFGVLCGPVKEVLTAAQKAEAPAP
jgi:AcrR family transcriptional regulator